MEKAVENGVSLQNLEIVIAELKHKSMNLNKVACCKNVDTKKFINSYQRQNINNQANYANSDVNKGKLKCINVIMRHI